MIVDVKTELISLNVNPEYYKVLYYLEPYEFPKRELIYNELSKLLTLDFVDLNTFTTSIVDLFIFNKLIENQYILNLTNNAVEVLKKYIEQKQKVKDIKAGLLNDSVQTTLKNQPFDDQKSTIAFMLAREMCGNFSSVGVGKTISALACFNILKNKNRISNGLVFVLNQNKLSWADEIKKHTNYSYKTVGNGTEVVVKDIEEFNEDLLVVHYDSVLSEEVVLAIIEHKFDFIVCDEAHVLRNYGKKKYNRKIKKYEPTCQRAEAIFRIKEILKPKYIFPLTGTPIPENPQNAFALLKLLCGHLIPDRTTFENHFCNFIRIPIKRGSRIKIKVLNKSKPFKNLDQLSVLLENYSIRKTQDDVRGFPPTLISIKEIEISPKERKIYNRIREETYRDIAAMPEKALNLDQVFIKTLRLRQFLSNPAILGEEVDGAKMLYLDELLEEILEDPKQKVILFSCFRPTLDALAERYKEKYGAVIYAGTNENLKVDERDLNVNLFMNDPNTRVLALNTSLAVGSNYGLIARTGIICDVLRERLHYVQSIGRLTRLTAKGCSNIMLLFAHDTVDTELWDKLQFKIDTSNELVGKDQELTIQKDKVLSCIKR